MPKAERKHLHGRRPGERYRCAWGACPKDAIRGSTYCRSHDQKHGAVFHHANAARRNPRQIDDDKDILIDIFTEGDGSERWVKETTCTLAEFFAENETVDRDEVRPKLFMRGQYVDGGGASVLWKIAFHK